MKSSLYVLGATVLVTTDEPDADALFLEATNNTVVELEPVEAGDAFKGVNLMADDAGAGLWQPSVAGPIGIGTNIAPDWTAEAGLTHYITMPVEMVGEGAVYHDPTHGSALPVLEENEYVFSLRLAAHRCAVALRVELFGEDGSLLKSISKSCSALGDGGKKMTGYDFSFIVFYAPKGARFVRLSILSEEITPTQTDDPPYIFFLLPSLTLTRGKIPRGWLEPKPEFLQLQKDLHRAGVRLFAPERPLTRGADRILVSLRTVGRETVAEAVVSGLPLFAGELHLSGRRVTASIRHATGGDISDLVGDKGRPSALGLALYVDGKCDNIGVGQKTDNPSERLLTMRVSADWFDGKAHHLEVRTVEGQTLLHDVLVLMPHTIDYEAIRTYTMPPYKNQMSPLAGLRYRSLQAQMARAGALGAEGIAQIGLMHEIIAVGFEKNRNFPHAVFPKVDRPKVSVIIPVHNKFEVTYHCLASLLLAYCEASFEVIVVDDGSTDRTRELGELVDNITIVRHEEAQGFVGACNAGAAVARGEYIVLLNNDTEATYRWLDELLFVMERFDNVGLVGSKLIYPDGTLQEAGGVVWADGLAWNYGKRANAHDPAYNYVRPVHYCSGAAMMTPRAVWDEVGGLGEEFAPAYYEDTDIAFKVRSRGYKTLYAPQSVIVHYEGLSNGTEVASSGLKRYQEINRPKFVAKWPDFSNSANKEGVDAHLYKDAGVTKRALFIDYQVPRTDYDAGSYAAVQEIRLMQSLGYKVTFLPGNLAYLGKYVEQLQRMGVEMIYAPFFVSIEEFMQVRGREFGVVYITRYYVAQDSLRFVRNHAPQAKVLLNNADLHFLRETRAALLSGDEADLKKAQETRGCELAMMREVDMNLSYSEVEHAVILSHNMEKSRVMKAPWVVDVLDDIPAFSARDGIAFLGGYGHPPNVEAVRYFVRDVMPALRQALPDIKLYIYGSSMNDDVASLAADDVIVVGHVEDVAAVYTGHRLFIAPLLSGAGIKGKVLAAMAHGIPTILSPVAAEGTGARHAYDCHIATTTDDWVTAISELYNDEASWELISIRSRDFVAQNFSFDRARQDLLKALKATDCPYDEKTGGLFIKSASMALEP